VASARAHAAVTAPSFAEVAVGSLVDEQLALLRARVGDAKRARLRIDVNVDPSITIEADRILLGQALSNVLQNAVEAYPETAEGEELEIGLRVASECPKGDVLVTIAVEDRGRGIDAKWIANVGEPFISTKGRGRGLGMLNVKKMVESVHGGVVDIDSEVGRGTRVELRVPRKQSRGKRPVRKSRAKVAE
jgi:signal transduction histidine kinase